MKTYLKSQNLFVKFQNSNGKQTRQPQASPTWWLCTLSNLIFYNLILNPEWKEKGEPTCNTTIIITGNNINDCDFCTYQNNEDHWSQTDFHRDSEDSLVARFRQHAACRVSNSLSHFEMAIISFDENRIKHEVTEVLLRCYRLRWEFSSTEIHLWNTVWRTRHVLILDIVLLITSSAFNPIIDRSIDAKKLFLAMLCMYVCMYVSTGQYSCRLYHLPYNVKSNLFLDLNNWC